MNSDHTHVTPYKVCLYEGMQAGVYRLKKKFLQKLHKLDQGNRTVYSYLNSLKDVMKNLQMQLPKMGDVGVDQEEALRVRQKFERAKTRLEKATYCYRQILISPWVTSSNFLKVHGSRQNSRETLQIVDRAAPPCKSMDPLGAQGDGFVYHLPGTHKRGKRNRDRTSSFDEGADDYTEDDIKQWSETRRREELLKIGVSSRQIDALATWEQKRRLKQYHLGQGKTKGRTEKYRDRVDRIFKAQLRMLAETGGEDSDSSSSSDDEIPEDLERKLEANMDSSRRRIETKKSSRASEEKAGMDLMQVIRQQKMSKTTTTTSTKTNDDDKLAKVRDILSKKLPAQSSRSFIPPPPVITASSSSSSVTNLIKPISRNSSSSSLLGSRSVSTAQSRGSTPGSSVQSSMLPTPSASRPGSPIRFAMRRGVAISERSNKPLVLVKTEIQWSITGDQKIKRIYFKNQQLIKKHVNKEKKKRQMKENLKKRARSRTLMGVAGRGLTAQELHKYKLLKEKQKRAEETRLLLEKQKSMKRKRGEKKCSACGLYGHTRTSRQCMYNVNKGRPQLGGKIKSVKFKKDQLKNLTSKGSLKLTLSKKKIADANIEGRRMRRQRQMEEARLYVFFFPFLSPSLSLSHTHTHNSGTMDRRKELHLRNEQRE